MHGRELVLPAYKRIKDVDVVSNLCRPRTGRLPHGQLRRPRRDGSDDTPGALPQAVTREWLFRLRTVLGRIERMPGSRRSPGEMRESGVLRVDVFCSDYRCSHSTNLPADRWPDHIRLSDIEPHFVCKACAELMSGRTSAGRKEMPPLGKGGLSQTSPGGGLPRLLFCFEVLL